MPFRMPHVLRVIMASLFLVVAAGALPASAAESFRYGACEEEEHRLTIRDQAPTIDGRVDDAEWRLGTRIEVFGDDHRRASGLMLVTRTDLCVAVISQLPDTGDLVSNVERDGTDRMVHDDSVEVWVSQAGGRKGQFMTNANGRRWARTKGIKDWAPAWQTASSIVDGRWHCEASIPLAELTDKALAAAPWSINLWRNWKTPWTQAFMIGRLFDAVPGNRWSFVEESLPAVHLRERGNRHLGEMNFALEFVSADDAERQVRARLRLIRDGGEEVVREQELAVSARGTGALTLECRDESSKNFRLLAEAVDAASGAVLFRHHAIWRRMSSTRWDTPILDHKTALGFRCGRFPSENVLRAEADVSRMPVGARVDRVRLSVCEKASGAVVASGVFDRFEQGRQELVLPLPATMEGEYEAVARAEGEGVPDEQRVERIVCKRFPWEGRALGVTDEIFPPFEPLAVRDREVSPVLRTYRMNGQGLWDSVTAKGREILAAPMSYVAVAADGRELPWRSAVEQTASAPHRVSFRARSTCAAVELESSSEIEMDGMMKVTLKLRPVADAVPLRRLSLEIPLAAADAVLLHEVTDALRQNFAGRIPAGEGEVWTSLDSFRIGSWLNAFTGYIWLGGAERGICWFAENDRGWITAKNFEQPLMRITRAGDRVTLRVDLVNLPGAVAAPTELVFGLQASPTRPSLRERKLFTGGAHGFQSVIPWGGMACGWKQPWDTEWQVVDKILEAVANDRKLDTAWFDTFEKEHRVPLRGGESWRASSVMNWVNRLSTTGIAESYFEEMAVLTVWPEYHVYQDEWRVPRTGPREFTDMETYRMYETMYYDPVAKPTFCRSYVDYTLSLMSEWLKRGVSVKFDNFYPKVSDNPWTSAAYRLADGRIQPATTLWNQREYLKRTWNLLNQTIRNGAPRPIEVHTHMSTTQIIPWFTWSVVNCDLEYSPSTHAAAFPDYLAMGEPYPWDFLLAETAGAQVGVYPYSFPLFKDFAYPLDALGTAPGAIEATRRDWGMRTVHRLMVDSSLLWDGKESAYWDDDPPFRVDNDEVKGLLRARPEEGMVTLLLQSWLKGPADITVTLDPQKLGFTPGPYAREAFTGRSWRQDGVVMKFRLDFPYQTLLVRLSRTAPVADVLFSDDFDRGLGFGWDYYSKWSFSGPDLADGALRFHKDGSRIFKFLALPDYADASLEFSLRLERKPDADAELLNIAFPAGPPTLKLTPPNHGLLQDDLNRQFVSGGVQLSLSVKGGQLLWRAAVDGAKGPLAQAASGAADEGVHQVRVFSGADGRYRVTVDGREVLAAADVPVRSGSAFGFRARRAATVGAVRVDDLVLRAGRADRTRLDAALRDAKERLTEFLANRRNELLDEVAAAYGAGNAKAICNLSKFRRIEADTAALIARLDAADSPAQRRVLLKLFSFLPLRQEEHVKFMTGIGQDAIRLPEFTAAREKAASELRARLERFDADTRPAAEALVRDLAR